MFQSFAGWYRDPSLLKVGMLVEVVSSMDEKWLLWWIVVAWFFFVVAFLG
jgi:hypothetical protein